MHISICINKGWLLLLTILVVALATIGSLPQVHAQRSDVDGEIVPQYIALHGQTKVNHSQHALETNTIKTPFNTVVNTLPFWSSVFNYNGIVYPFQMVGTDPSLGSHSTTVPVELIPLKLVFSNGTILDGTQKVASTVASPLFQSADFNSGTTQFGDAMQRAGFWKYIVNNGPDYHVLLGHPKVYPTVTLNVPANQGMEGPGKRTGAPVGKIAVTWFDLQIQSLLGSLHLSPRTLPIFLDHNAFLYEGGNPKNCCIAGYHNAVSTTRANGASQINTYVFASYNDAGIFKEKTIADIDALSHEVAEWFNDPFTDNYTPNWSSLLATQYGCSNILEDGDPLVGVNYEVNGYHLQDVAFYSWFAKQVPSVAIKGRYTYRGKFRSPGPTC